LEEFQEEVDKLIAEINAATDQGLTLMDDRINRIKTLLEETDRRMSVYKKESERRTVHDRSYAELGKKTVVKNIEAPSLFAESDSASVPDVKAAPVENNSQLSNEGPRFIRSSIRVEAKTPFAEQVLQLANSGFSNDLIAKKLGAAIAEVELVMNLAERNREAGKKEAL
jgi:hypothetical protein